MRAAKRPELLICRELTRPLEFATMGLRHLRDELTEVPGPLCTEGLFVLVMARCDAMLQDSLRCYLRGVPGKIPFERERKEIRREDAVSTDLPARLADRYVQQWGYKATAIMVRTYCHLLSVNEVTQGTLEAIVYAKDKRNRILHDAPPEPWLPGTLASHGVRIDDVRKAADAVEALTGELKQAIEAKYGAPAVMGVSLPFAGDALRQVLEHRGLGGLHQIRGRGGGGMHTLILGADVCGRSQSPLQRRPDDTTPARADVHARRDTPRPHAVPSVDAKRFPHRIGHR